VEGPTIDVAMEEGPDVGRLESLVPEVLSNRVEVVDRPKALVEASPNRQQQQ
jgi:hypothetical protein